MGLGKSSSEGVRLGGSSWEWVEVVESRVGVGGSRWDWMGVAGSGSERDGVQLDKARFGKISNC